MALSIFGPSIDVMTKTLSFLEERGNIIADNIANAGTPSYKAKAAPVEEFRAALARAIETHRRDPRAPLSLGSSRHISDMGARLRVRAVAKSALDAGTLKHDGNNVSLEAEMNDLAQNTLAYGVLSNLLRKQFVMIKAAIAERVDV